MPTDELRSNSTCVTYRTGQEFLSEFELTGAEHAFEEIVRLYAGMVYTVCKGVTKNSHDAEDATQAVFLALATQVKSGKKVNYLGPWLRQVAKRTAMDLRKSRKRREKREENHSREHADLVEQHQGQAKLDAEIYKQALHDEIERLPQRYRLPLVMHYFGGLRPEETAIELNCKPKTLAVRLHRGRKLLAQSLSRRGIFAGSGQMLGFSLVPLLPATLHTDVVHSTSHAAAGLMTGQDISAIISDRVMALLRGSAKAALFAKLKFVAAVVVLCSSVFAGGAQIARTLGPLPLHWPDLKLDISQWIKPMLKSLTPSPKFSDATAKPANRDVKPDKSPAHPLYASAGAGSFPKARNVRFLLVDGNRVVLTSHDTELVGGAYATNVGLLENASMVSSLNDVTAGSLQTVSRGPTTPTWSLDPANATAADWAGSMTSDGAPILVRRVASTNPVPTPEPSSLLLIAAGGSLLIRRRDSKN